MVIGYATVSVSLSITGNANVISDLDDFNVYFSNVLVNESQDLRLVKSDKELVFNITLNDLGDVYKISYDVTNGSKLFDASLSINCTNGNEYLGVLNEFDTSNLSALSTRTGNLTLTKIQTNSEENQKHFTVTCTIVASPIGKETIGSGTVINPVKPIELEIGDVIGIDGEKFNIISQTDTTVTMLAQYNIGTDYRQSTTENWVVFSENGGWTYTPGPKEIDIQTYTTETKIYVNEYVSYLKNVTSENNISGNLITMNELKVLGCKINNNYSYTDDLTCVNSEYKDWLINDQFWWTRSAEPNDVNNVWIVYDEGRLSYDIGYHSFGVRPVITIPIALARLHYVKSYKIGEEVSIGSEKFNIISQTETTVTMFAQYNLGPNYIQDESENDVSFSNSNGWAYTPGPKEIDIQAFDGNAKTYLNEYVSYLKSQTGDDSLTGTLITLTDLKSLGCSINDDYTYSSDNTCENSSHKLWLINEQLWWTRSAFSNKASIVMTVYNDGSISNSDFYYYGLGIRPVITISKDAL
jgi:hypothetical protein